MFRYIAFAWNEADPAQREASELLANRLSSVTCDRADNKWTAALLVPGLKVFCVGARAGSSDVCYVPDEIGVLLGTVFEPTAEASQVPPKRKTFSRAESRQLLSTGGRAMFTGCWGRYVAFLQDRPKQKSYVLRDPTGGMPCFHVAFHGVDIYFSSVEDCLHLRLLSFSVNWDFIAARVVFVFLHTRETALNEVTEVLAGECLEIDRGVTSRSLGWNPFEVARTDVIEDAGMAARELRRVAKACIHAWAGCYTEILHRLSGGLDSSVVLGCLQDAPSSPTVTSLNYYSSGSNGDERHFAQLAAQHAGSRMVVWERNPDAVRLTDMLAINKSAAPILYLGPLQASRPEAQLAREIGARAIFGGAGGDQLFYQARAILGAVDFLRINGPTLGFIKVALDTARLECCSIWRVMLAAVKNGGSQSWDPRADAFNSRKLVADDVIAHIRECNRITHPLFESGRDVPPGKLLHAYTLSFPQEFYDPFGSPDDPERVQPLMSQPLIELCLRIPTYVLTSNGWDRAIARRAFREDVPQPILRRRSKGGIEEHAQRILLGNIDTARDLLLNGHLARERLLDRHRIEEVLSGRPTRIVGAMGEIFDLLSTEAWIRSWSGIATNLCA